MFSGNYIQGKKIINSTKLFLTKLLSILVVLGSQKLKFESNEQKFNLKIKKEVP